MFDANTPADVVIKAINDAGVSPVEMNDFLAYRKAVARNAAAATKAGMAAKKAALIKKHPILVDLDQYLTAVGR